MTRIAFLHTHSASECGGWRVFPCLVLREDQKLILGKWCRTARLLYVDESGGMRIVDEQHFEDRTGFGFWVLQTELKTMYEYIKDDWDHRHLWAEDWRDIQDAMKLSGFIRVKID